nr:adhesion G-protein coupled receptor G7 [Marmota flaviventris]
MARCRPCDLRVLVAVACGLLTAIILGLGIWRTVIRIQRVTVAPPSSTPAVFCRNGGTWENGRCICTEEWKGLRCTIANFCENSTYMGFTFARIPVGRYGTSLETCDKNTLNAGSPIAIRLCNVSIYGEIELQNATIGNCNENLETLENQIVNITVDSKTISAEAQVLTSDASKLTAENITSATKVVGQIFNASRKAEPEAKKVAVTTVSQLLDASEDAFQRAAATDNDNAFTTRSRETQGGLSVQIPLGSAVQHSSLLGSGAGPSLKWGSYDLSDQIGTKACGFVLYQNNKLFQSKTFTAKSNFSQKIISSKVNENDQDQTLSVEMVFSPKYQKEYQLHAYACVYWNFLTKDWDTYGCYKDKGTDGFLGCRCNHTTNFAVLMTFKKDYKYPESLDILSNIGCALSITGLALTIIFQIVTRKVRKTSVTWVMVSLCTSMLIFNLIFVFGIENSNKNLNTRESDIDIDFDDNQMLTEDTIEIPNPSCTVIAAFLHYFLLATFTWSGLSASQLYFLLIRAMKPLPPHFIIFISLIGWGVPAIVVAITVGIIYSQSGSNSHWELDYRQEEICWLAIPNNNDFIKSPFLWSFLIPTIIILISNVVIFIVITIKVLWKNNQNLTSTKKVSSLKKILSTLSIAVVFGVTWILSYFMLINDDDIRIVFSYVFCLFNTTQGLQIFILYTVRTKIFQSEASKVWKSLSSSVGRVKSLPSLRLRVRMYNMLRSLPALHESFRLLEPSEVIEETTLTESDQASSSN